MIEKLTGYQKQKLLKILEIEQFLITHASLSLTLLKVLELKHKIHSVYFHYSNFGTIYNFFFEYVTLESLVKIYDCLVKQKWESCNSHNLQIHIDQKEVTYENIKTLD